MKTPSIVHLVAACLASVAADAAVLASWGFETNTPADLADSSGGPVILSESGVKTTAVVQGAHASAAADWTTPQGNGSANSLSVNNWAIGDYFAFVLDSTGYQGITLAFDQVGSSTGPRDFQLSYSTDGGSFTNFGSVYQVLENTSTNAWTSSPVRTTTRYAFDLGSVTGIDNAPVLHFRLTNTTSTSIGGATVGATGASRIDNIVISAAATSIPEPSSTLGLLGGAAALIAVSRRRR